MRDEERKAWEELIGVLLPNEAGVYLSESRCHGNAAIYRPEWGDAILAAYRELKQRREDEEWLYDHSAAVGHGVDGMKWVYWSDGKGQEREACGPTLHAAIAAAKGEGK